MRRAVLRLLLLLALLVVAAPAAAQSACFESPLPTVVPEGEDVATALLPGGARIFMWRATCDTSGDRVGVLARLVPPGPSNPLACAATLFSFSIDGVALTASPLIPCPLTEPLTVVVERVCAQDCPPLGAGTFAPDRQAVFALSGGTQAILLPPLPPLPPAPTVEVTASGCNPCAGGAALAVQAVVTAEAEQVVEFRVLVQHPDGSITAFPARRVELVAGETIVPILNILVPGDTEPGAYHFQARLLDPATADTVAIDRLRVERSK